MHCARRSGFRVRTLTRAPRNDKLSRPLDGVDVDLRFQRLVHRALVGDLHELFALLGVERAFQRDGVFDVSTLVTLFSQSSQSLV